MDHMEAHLSQEFNTHEMDPWTKQLNGLSTFPNPPNQAVVAREEIFQCPYPDCEYESPCYQHVVLHEIRHGPLATRVLTCRFCVRNYESLFNFLRHMSSRHLNKLVCPLCPFVGQGFSEFKAHVLAHCVTGTNELPRLSLGYGNRFSPPQLVQSHMNIRDEIHPEIEIIEIQEDQAKDREGKLMEGRQGSWSCDKCSYKTSLPHEMRMHTRTHSSQKLFKCQNLGCDYKGQWAKGLQVHQRSCRRVRKTKSLLKMIVENFKEVETTKDIAAAAEPVHQISMNSLAKTESRGTIEVSVEEVRVQGDGLYSSITCHYGSKSKTRQRRHARVHKDQKPSCCSVNNGCNSRAELMFSVSDHSRTTHSIELPSEMPVQPKEDLRLDKDCEIIGEVNVRSNCSSVAFHCMLCEFVGDSELSAWEHARQHQAVVVT